jgi:DNA-binding NtrC family response regulator
MKMLRVAVIDDEKITCDQVKRVLEQDGFQVETFLSGQPYLLRMREESFDIVFIDLNLPDIRGLEVLQMTKQTNEETEAIIVTGFGTIETAVDAIQKGAFHYITKPCKRHDIRLFARRAAQKIELQKENRQLREAMSNNDPIAGFIGTSPAMQAIIATIKKIATVNCNVLLEAETGTGKQMVARAIHSLSQRKDKPFVYFNCGGFSEELITSELFGHEKGSFTGAASRKKGLFETAAGGTVLMDEVGEMPLSMQVKLLHVLQERQVLRVGGTEPIDLDIRIIAATNKKLQAAINAGIFREDLYYRLNVVNIQLPRLAERKEDIPLLASFFINKFNRAFNKQVSGISPQALNLLSSYGFPGNVRELENIIQRAVALTDKTQLQCQDLPPGIQQLSLHGLEQKSFLTLEEVEKKHIEKVLAATNFNKNLASDILDLPRTTLWRRMKKFGLQGDDETEA